MCSREEVQETCFGRHAGASRGVDETCLVRDFSIGPCGTLASTFQNFSHPRTKKHQSPLAATLSFSGATTAVICLRPRLLSCL